MADSQTVSTNDYQTSTSTAIVSPSEVLSDSVVVELSTSHFYSPTDETSAVNEKESDNRAVSFYRSK